MTRCARCCRRSRASAAETDTNSKKAASVAVPSSYELSFWYGDQYEVKLGNSENLPYKLAYLEKVLESLADYQTGTIDLSFSEGSEARFTPKQ